MIDYILTIISPLKSAIDLQQLKEIMKDTSKLKYFANKLRITDNEYLHSIADLFLQDGYLSVIKKKMESRFTLIVVYETNATAGKEINEFELLMKTPKKIHGYKSKFNTTDDAYIELIGKLFVNHESLIGIKKR